MTPNAHLTFSVLDEDEIHTFVVIRQIDLHRDFDSKQLYFIDDDGQRQLDVRLAEQEFVSFLSCIDLKKIFIEHLKFSKDGSMTSLSIFSTGPIDMYEGRKDLAEFLNKKYRSDAFKA